MNLRIKQLWDTAAKLESDPSWEGQTKFMAKFAELIVRECAHLIDTREPRSEPAPHIYLLKQFGIEP